MIPDFEALLFTYLKNRTEIQQLGAQIVPVTPSSTADPWVRVTQLDADSAQPHIDHVVGCMVQLDCYAAADGGQEEASELTRRVREALRVMRFSSHSGAVITDAQFLSCPRLPDEDFEPARERYALTAIVYGHSDA